ncbi:MAG: right-handed parallel beta-helix repeat-containing protein [Nitrospirota bacterium]|nr:right-handed parallel beta-helix repeat-containing protein [Nitrospirota bacterium]
MKLKVLFALVTGLLAVVLTPLSSGIGSSYASGSTNAFHAVAGNISAPFSVTSGSRTYVSQTASTIMPTHGGLATYRFSLPAVGNYIINASVNAPNSGTNSFYINIDTDPATVTNAEPNEVWDVAPLTSGFAQRIVSWRGAGSDGADQFTPKVFSLSTGLHTLYLRGREGNTQVAAFVLSAQSAPPSTQALTPTPTPTPTSSSACPSSSTVISGGASIANGIADTPAGGTLCLDGGTYSIDTTMLIQRPITIVGANVPLVTETFAGLMFDVMSDNVTVQGLKLVGANHLRTGNGCGGPEAIAVAANTGVKILNNVVDTFTCGLIFRGTRGHLVQGNHVSTIKYSAITNYPGINGTIDSNTITNVDTDGSLGENAYGVTNSAPDASHLSTGMTISNNTVDQAPTWECYDTHDGQSVSFVNNTCINPGRVGLNAVYSGVAQVQNIQISGNLFQAGSAAATACRSWCDSIVLTGSGSVRDNAVKGYPGGNCNIYTPAVSPSGNRCTS